MLRGTATRESRSGRTIIRCASLISISAPAHIVHHTRMRQSRTLTRHERSLVSDVCRFGCVGVDNHAHRLLPHRQCVIGAAAMRMRRVVAIVVVARRHVRVVTINVVHVIVHRFLVRLHGTRRRPAHTARRRRQRRRRQSQISLCAHDDDDVITDDTHTAHATHERRWRRHCARRRHCHHTSRTLRRHRRVSVRYRRRRRARRASAALLRAVRLGR
jgi:hypothetical protein